MSWAKIDDQMHTHEKHLAISLAAEGLWVRCLSWAADKETDGFVPNSIVNLHGGRQAKKLIAELLCNFLWCKNEDGYIIHDYLVYNKSHAQLEAERTSSASRQGKFRAKKECSSIRDKHRSNAVSNAVTNGVSNAEETPAPVPVPVLAKANPSVVSHASPVTVDDSVGNRTGRGSHGESANQPPASVDQAPSNDWLDPDAGAVDQWDPTAGYVEPITQRGDATARASMRVAAEKSTADAQELLRAFLNASSGVPLDAPLTDGFWNRYKQVAFSLLSVGATPELMRLAVENQKIVWPTQRNLQVDYIERNWATLTSVKHAAKPAAQVIHRDGEVVTALNREEYLKRFPKFTDEYWHNMFFAEIPKEERQP